MAKETKSNSAREAAAKPAKTAFSQSKKLVFILGLVALLTYANTLRNGYVLDDFVAIQNNTLVTKGISGIPELLSTPYHKGNFVAANDLYRPLSLTMFAIEYELFGGSPMPGHLINILIFAGCVILLFLFFDALFEKKRTSVAFIASLLFALHPIHTEVVANIKSRDELLCFFLSFIALNLFIKYAEKGKINTLITGGACMFLALLSKETAITFLFVIPLAFFFYRNENKKRGLHITAATVLATIVFLAIRFAVLKTYHADNMSDVHFMDNPLVKAHGYAERLATAMLVLGFYIKLLLVPYPLVCDYSYNSIPFAGFSNPGVIVSLIVYLSLIGAGIFLLTKNRKDPFAFGILFFLITISLFSNIALLIGAIMAERFTFFASVGFCLLLALIIDKWIGQPKEPGSSIFNNRKIAGVVLTIGGIYALMTISRNSDWYSNTTLYNKDVAKAPGNSRLYYYVGTDNIITAADETDPAAKKQLIEDGIRALKRSLAIFPDLPLTASQIGHEYFVMAQYDSAELYMKKATTLDPTDTLSNNTLAATYYYEQKYQESIHTCKNAIYYFHKYVKAYLNIGSCYLHMNNYDSAVYYYKQAISIDPENGSSYAHLAKAYTQMGNVDSAKKYEAVIQQKP